MAIPASNELALGSKAPGFKLPDPGGKWHSLETPGATTGAAPALLVAFICNHCPYVKHIRSSFAQFAREYQARGVEIVAISSNDVQAFPDDGPEKMAEEIATAGYTFPYLYDESQEVARAYGAVCTPDFFLFNRERRLVYRGQYDDSRPKNTEPVTGADLRLALDAILEGRSIPTAKPSVGCTIKWKPESASASGN